MLKLSVGYQCMEEGSFFEAVRPYLDAIEEIYFPWTDSPSGRSVIGGYDGYFDYALQERLLAELRSFRAAGKRLDLLFNANCYGADAISEALQGRVCAVLDFLGAEGLLPDAVTTTSLAIAQTVRERYPDIELRASVNMRIGSVKGMQYLAHLFDSFCVAKECNRDLDVLSDMRDWARGNGKRLVMLANSGCMRNCSGQIFHDNMVAHEAEISGRRNMRIAPYVCWNYLKKRENFVSVLQNTWVRPEDIDRYEGLVDSVKLATRSHHLPMMVIGAYARRRYFGNLLDLFEPGYAPAFVPYVIDSSRLPEDFWQVTTACNKKCESCSYCAQVLDAALVNTEH